VCAEEQEQEDGSPVGSVTSCVGQGQRVDPWEMVIITAISMIKPPREREKKRNRRKVHKRQN